MRRDMIDPRNPFVSYAYSYPHKLAYRPLEPAPKLADVWGDEHRSALFLYVHVPFCEFRCGFCNLFTVAQSAEDLSAAYLSRVRAEASAFAQSVPDSRFVRFALGGGTPTVLSETELTQLFDAIEERLDSRLSEMPAGCEASPATIDRGKLRLLRDRGVDRISVGVQTFDDQESRRLGRPQRGEEAHRALDAVREFDFPTLNVDLIYGMPGHTPAAFLRCVEETLRHDPEEIYLYPLYVRELTGLGNVGARPEDDRLSIYRAGRDRLLESGYEQISLRMFRRPMADQDDIPDYRCQADGMLGLGCGARSYTRNLHYSTDFATSRAGVRAILDEYLSRTDEEFFRARVGIRLDDAERERRYAILSLLQRSGLDRRDFARRFGVDPAERFPELFSLAEEGYAIVDDLRVSLTQQGVDYSDAIGPALYSDRINRLIAERGAA